MTKKGVLRIEIDPDLVPALKVEAAIRGLRERELVNLLIRAGLSERALEFVGAAKNRTLSASATQSPNTQIANAPRPKKRFISEDPNAMKLIREMYGKTSYQEIADASGWPKATIGETIKRMRKNGDLPELDK